MTALNPADELRLNVLLASHPLAIKINESRMQLLALTEAGEAKIALNPDSRPHHYFNKVREYLSSQVLGSPGGYPIFLGRWTRMGQARQDSLERLLLLAEDEAVIAVVHAPNLTPALAARAWWALPDPENARQMLRNQAVAKSSISTELSEYLLEFLPFEQESQAEIDSVHMLLSRGRLSREQRENLWRSAGRKSGYYVGFLLAAGKNAPDIPINRPAHSHLPIVSALLQKASCADSVLLNQLMRVFSAEGQAFLFTVCKAFEKPGDQQVVVALMNAIGQYFSSLNKQRRRYTDLSVWKCEAEQELTAKYSNQLKEVDEHLRPCCHAMIALAFVDETLVNPVFTRTDAVGSVMRKRLNPVSQAVLSHVNRLLAGSG